MKPAFQFELTQKSLEKSLPRDPVRDSGAELEFLGIVRDMENRQRISAIDYEAYPPMALRVGKQLVNEIKKRYPIQSLRVIHRLGKVRVGEISLRVRVRSCHRGEAFEACRKFIERMKEDLPIWKNPVYHSSRPPRSRGRAR